MLFTALWLAALVITSGQQVRCPDGFTAPTTYTGYCYKYNTGTMTWNAHENACTQVTLNGQPYAGGHLATIFSAESARVVMDQYCNNLNQGQSHYFVGYFCISTAYSSRTDWRWTSGMPTTWLHQAPAYLSGAEPDDAGCGRAHYSDDGAIPGKIGDWVCSSPLAGGCCEAPVLPTPSPSSTSTNTPTSTATSSGTQTRTASASQTATQTATFTGTGTNTLTATATRTQSSTNTETRTASATSTATRTATSTLTPSSSPSVTSSESVSSSVSPSVSPTSSESSSVSNSASASPSMSISATRSISLTPPPARYGALLAMNGLLNDTEATALDAEAVTDSEGMNTIIIASSIGGLLAILAALCCIWFACCIARRRRTRRDAALAARTALQNAKLKTLNRGLSRRLQPAAGVASVLGLSTAAASLNGIEAPNRGGVSSLLGSMNPALVKAPMRHSTLRNPRMSVALAAYKNTSAFKPTGVRTMRQTLLDYGDSASQVQTETIVPDTETAAVTSAPTEETVDMSDDIAIGIHESEAADKVCEDGTCVADANADADDDRAADADADADGDADADADDDDAIDEDDPVAAGAATKRNGVAVHGNSLVRHKEKTVNESAASQSMSEQRKLIIGKGALIQEQVQKQTIKLRRVSKVKGDKDLTALRQGATDRYARPSVAARGVYEPQRPVSYAFTATVSRMIVKTDTDTPTPAELE